VAGAAAAAGPGLLLLKLGGADAVLALAAVNYGVGALLNLRLPQPDPTPPVPHPDDAPLGRVPALGLAAAGAAGLRAANGFLLFLLAFALRQGHSPKYWFAVLGVSGMAGGLLGDLIAPRLPPSVQEERVVLGSVLGAGVGAVVAFRMFELPVLASFGLLAGMAAELGRLAFQSLMQRSAPARSQGRVFVRYEVAFQLAWVGGALVPALITMSFRTGILVLAAFYLLIAADHVVRPRVLRDGGPG
jgi:hypothetical protein